MSARRYFWMLGAAYLVLIGLFPGSVALGASLCTQCGILLFPLVFLVPALPVAFAVFALWLAFTRCKTSGLSRLWAIPAFVLPLYGDGLFSANIANSALLLPMMLESSGAMLLAALLLQWIVPAVVLIFIGLGRPAGADRTERAAHVVAWLSMVWMAPMVFTGILPFGLNVSIRPHIGALTSVIYPDFIPRGYHLVLPMILLISALLWLLLRSNQGAGNEAPEIGVSAG